MKEAYGRWKTTQKRIWAVGEGRREERKRTKIEVLEAHTHWGVSQWDCSMKARRVEGRSSGGEPPPVLSSLPALGVLSIGQCAHCCSCWNGAWYWNYGGTRAKWGEGRDGQEEREDSYHF